MVHAASAESDSHRDAESGASEAPPRPSGRCPRALARILVADPSAEVRTWIRPALDPLRAEVIEVDSVAKLGRLLERQPVQLVIMNSQLCDGSTLQLLARLRVRGSRTPFIVHTSFQKGWLRAFVSNASGTVLSSRVLDAESLVVMAEQLMSESSVPELDPAE